MGKTNDQSTASVIHSQPTAVLNAAPRVADLRFDCQGQRESDIAADPFANFLAEGYTTAKTTQLESFLATGFLLPQVGSHPWVKALERVRRRLRLSMPIHVILLLQEEFVGHSAIGIQHQNGISLIMGQTYLEDANETELAYHFGVAIWKALDEKSFPYREILRRNCPVSWDIKEQLMNWGRFSMYSAACYGLLACGDLDTAITETWRQCLGRRAPHDSEGLLALAESYREEGHMPLLHLWEHYHQSGLYLVGLPLVLKAFSDSVTYADLVGGTGTSTRTDFQKQISDLDESLYGMPNELDAEFIQFLSLCSTLTRAHVFEASPNYSLEALHAELEPDFMEESEFINCMSEMGLGPDGTEAAIKRLQDLNGSPFTWAIPLFCNDFITGSLQIAARESVLHPECQSALNERLNDVLTFCSVDRDFADLLAGVMAEEEADD